MGRSIILGVVGDSAAGKTTLTRGLARVLGEENVTYVCVDDYHRYDRRQRAERNITPLHPDCNFIDIMAQDIGHMRAGEPFLKPVYQHKDGTFGPPVRIDPRRFSVVEGLLGYYTDDLRGLFDVKIYLADPMGSGIYSWYARHEFKPEGSSITEGIGNNRETKNLEGFAPDGQYQITDEEMLPILFSLAFDEGLILGGSTGINVCGAIRLARDLGPGHTIVTILADSGTRYLSKLFNPAFLAERNLPTPRWLQG